MRPPQGVASRYFVVFFSEIFVYAQLSQNIKNAKSSCRAVNCALATATFLSFETPIMF